MAEADETTGTTSPKPSGTTKRTIITDELRNFYASHGVDVDRLKKKKAEDVNGDGEEAKDNNNNPCFASRFIRLNPRVDTVETLTKLKIELQDLASKIGNGGGNSSNNNSGGSKTATSTSTTMFEPISIPWLDEKLGFYALPGNFKLSQSQCYQEGRIYGMDVSSGAAVAALLSNQYDKKNEKDKEEGEEQQATTDVATSHSLRVLDLCCAPGLKLCALADYFASLGRDEGGGGKGSIENSTTSSSDPDNSASARSSNHVVVGVDISEHRIATTKRILQKYRMQQQPNDNDDEDDPVRIRLYCGDGTTFDQPFEDANQLPNLVFDSRAANEQSAISGKRKRMNKSAKARERKRLKSLATIDFYRQKKIEQQGAAEQSKQEEMPNSDSRQEQGTTSCGKIPSEEEEETPQQSTSNMTSSSSSSSSPWIAQAFDFVLVDAECSTDGSLKHIQKQINAASAAAAAAGNDGCSSRRRRDDDEDPVVVAPLLMDSNKLAELVQLQKQLAAAGYRLLKPGGSMVYSTCSLSRHQNENVVQWLLQEFADTAFLVPLDFTSSKATMKRKRNTDSVDSYEDAFNPKIKEGQWGVRFEPSLAAAATTTTEQQELLSSKETPEGANSQMFFGGGFFLAKIGKRKQAGI